MVTTTTQNDASGFETPIPGQWLLNLPFAPATISIRRYTCPSRIPIPAAESSADAARRAALEAIQAEGGEDALERAWRAVNGVGANDAGTGVEDVLRSPCAVVGDVDGVRQLWMFEVRGPNGSARDQYHNDALDDLSAVEGGSESFQIADLLSCPSHGSASSCLMTASSSGCDVAWKPGKLARSWSLFTSAVGEKLAWRNGRRVCLEGKLRGRTSQISLRPIATQHLLLSLRPGPNPAPTSKPTDTILLPSRQSATRLSSFEPIPPQLDHLEQSFTSLLGPAWKAPLTKSLVLDRSSQIITWAVYWVHGPQLPSNSHSNEAAPDPTAKSSSHKRGVIVVWPSSLILANPPTPIPPTRQPRKRSIAAISDVSAAGDIMGIASGLFDFFSTYTEPIPELTPNPEVATSTAGDLPTPQTGTRGSESSPVAVEGTVQTGDAMEEDDDLFSSNSSSPALPPDTTLNIPDAQIPDDLVPGTADDFDDLFGDSGEEGQAPAAPVELDKDFEMGSPEAAYVAPNDDGYEPYGAADEITAEDFAFLDSPAAERGDDGRVEGAEPEDGNGDDGPERPETDDQEQAGQKSSAGEHLREFPRISPPVDPESPVKPSVNINSTEPSVSDPALLSAVSAEQSSPLSSKDAFPPPSTSDLIPSPFAPLDISRPTSILSPVDTFPTPAPTPQSHNLRDDLVERLRQAKRQKGDGDYTTGWHIEEDASETEEGFDDSGAPPTPMSEDNTEGDDETVTVGSQKGGEGGGDLGGLVEWRGTRCWGAELVWMKDDERVWDIVSCSWNDEWGTRDLGPATLPSPPASPIAKPRSVEPDLDLDRIAREIIANRHFRHFLIPKSTPDFRAESEIGAMSSTGSALSNLLSPNPPQSLDIGTGTSRTLGSCNVHAGFAGNVMRLSIAGLKYWRQLGLSPVGGEKHVSSAVLTDLGDESKRAATAFLAGMEEVWEQHRLGPHLAKTESVVQVAMKSMADVSVAISDLARSCDPNTNLVIYVLLDGSAQPSTALSILQHPLPDTAFIHIIYDSSIQPRQLPDIALDVYNRIPRLLHHIASTPPRPPTYLQYPSFTLAPDQTPTPSLTLEWPLRSYDVFNRWRWVHAAYTRDEETGLAVGFIIDAEGENYEVKTFRTKGRRSQEWLRLIWESLVDFAGRAAIEWRMSLTRVGGMTKEELDALKEVVRGAYVTLLFVDPQTLSSPAGQTTTTAPVPAPVFSDPTAHITDDTLAARTSTYSHRIPLSLTPDDGETSTIYPLLSFVISNNASSPVSENTLATYHVLSHRPAPGKEGEKVEILSMEFQKMICIGRLRFGFEGGATGVHVAAVLAVGGVSERLSMG